MKKTQIYPITHASQVIYVQKPDGKTPTSEDTLQGALNEISTKYAAKETAGQLFKNHIAVSGMPASYNIPQNATALDILKVILSPEYAPYMGNSTVNISLKNGTHEGILNVLDTAYYPSNFTVADFTITPVTIVAYSPDYTTYNISQPIEGVNILSNNSQANQVNKKNYKDQAIAVAFTFGASDKTVCTSSGTLTQQVADSPNTVLTTSVPTSSYINSEYRISPRTATKIFKKRYYQPDIILETPDGWASLWGNNQEYTTTLSITHSDGGDDHSLYWYVNSNVQYDRYTKDLVGKYTVNNSNASINGNGETVQDGYELEEGVKKEYYGYYDNSNKRWTISSETPQSGNYYTYYKMVAFNTTAMNNPDVSFKKKN